MKYGEYRDVPEEEARAQHHFTVDAQMEEILRGCAGIIEDNSVICAMRKRHEVRLVGEVR